MKSINKIRVLICITVLVNLFSNPTSVYACSCMVPNSPADSFTNYDVVFSGKVVKIEDSRGVVYDLLRWIFRNFELPFVDYFLYLERFQGLNVTFKVINSWKFVNTSSIDIKTGYGDADCGYSFETGREYLVYASNMPGNYLYSNTCTRNNILPNASEDLAYLNTIETIKLFPAPPLQILSSVIFVSFVLLAISIYWRNKNKRI